MYIKDRLNVDIEKLTYFMVTLFYETDCKYTCSRTKIGKLLSILAFKYATEGITLFDSKIYKYDGCGTYIRESAIYLDRDEYLRFDYQDNKEYITDEFTGPDLLPLWNLQRYDGLKKLSDCLAPNIKKDAEDVFRIFGAYSQVDLGNCLNPIVENITTERNGEIDLSKISSAIENVDQGNEIVKYLKYIPLNSKTTSSDDLVERKNRLLMKILDQTYKNK